METGAAERGTHPAAPSHYCSRSARRCEQQQQQQQAAAEAPLLTPNQAFCHLFSLNQTLAHYLLHMFYSVFTEWRGGKNCELKGGCLTVPVGNDANRGCNYCAIKMNKQARL